MDVYPIRTEADYQRSLADIAGLMHAERGSPEGERLDVLATLVEVYEQKQLTRRDLEPAIGGRTRVSEVLNRRRALTLPMIRALSQMLDIPADVLIQPYETTQSTQGRSERANAA